MNETENPNPDNPKLEAGEEFLRTIEPAGGPRDQLPGPPIGEIPLSEGSQTVIGRFQGCSRKLVKVASA